MKIGTKMLAVVVYNPPGTSANFTGEEESGEVILKGAGAKCGHEVVRVVETSESDSSGI